MPDRVLAEIEADIAEAERLISELRLEIAAKKSAIVPKTATSVTARRWL